MNRAYTVLNVEDHAPTRFLRTRILERAGFTVTEADSAAEAVARAGSATVVLLDVRLPDGDGFTVCERVKAATPDLPVVMISSVYRTAQARRDAFATGADAFLLEPVDPTQLVRTIESLVHKVPPAEPSDATWVITDAAGAIHQVSPAAAKLLNISARAARGRSLPTFVTDNRPAILADLLRAADGAIVESQTLLQPRDRRAKRVRIELAPLPYAPGEGIRIRWTITPL